ncbi:MAG: NADPH:quinone oxidoreductase family protein [Acidimicrobiales bacterium]
MARAVVCRELGSEDRLDFVADWPDPEPQPGEVVVEVEAASVNFPETLVIRGEYQLRPDLPFVPGSECAGTIAQVGDGVDTWQVGDRVLAMLGTGAFASRVAVKPSHQIHHIPDTMTFDQAAAFNLTYGTSMLALEQRGQVQPGETVLVLGASGGCGTAAIQIAAAMGATPIACARGPEKVEVCRRAGADEVIDVSAVESLSATVRQLTDGRGVDVVYDTVGGADIREFLRCLTWNGRFLVVGFASGTIPEVRLNQAILKSISIVGVAYGASAMIDPSTNNDNFRRLFSWFEQGLLSPVIGHRFPLERGAEAIKVLRDGDVRGKVVIEV